MTLLPPKGNSDFARVVAILTKLCLRKLLVYIRCTFKKDTVDIFMLLSSSETLQAKRGRDVVDIRGFPSVESQGVM